MNVDLENLKKNTLLKDKKDDPLGKIFLLLYFDLNRQNKQVVFAFSHGNGSEQWHKERSSFHDSLLLITPLYSTW